MQKEQQILQEDFNLLQKSEARMVNQIEGIVGENNLLDDKLQGMEKNANYMQPERLRETQDKLENLNNVLQAKDGVVEQLLQEIALVKNDKDEVQNDVLFKKQRIQNLNIEFNSKELEYQRIWEESQYLKQEMRGETDDAKDIKRENEYLQRDIAGLRDEVGQIQGIYEENQNRCMDAKSRIREYEDRLRYANDMIMQLEQESQAVQMDMAQSRAHIEAQNRAYNELKANFYLLSSDPNML